MPKLIDLTGQKFDKLLVLSKAESRNRHVYWNCKCECGNEIQVSGESLRKNIPHHCGCQLVKNQPKPLPTNRNYLIGQRFGKLVVIDEIPNKRINKSIVWLCKCDCGNTKEVPTHLLTSGHTKSCGCLIRETKSIDITGQRFGKLTALFPLDKNPTGRTNLYWHCQCDCGNECDIDGNLLRSGNTRSCGCINSSIGEINIKQILDNNNINYKKEFCFKELGRLRFDFAIFDKNNQIIRLIEFDGIQHFSDRKSIGWGDKNGTDSYDKLKQRDQQKNEWAIKNNIPLVRIPYWERDNIDLEMIMGNKYLVH